jgi:AcrR family transcriptional regulator
MRRTKEDAELTRQSLMDAALVVFSRQGYAGTRLQDIAKAAGVTRGAIYHHFGGKAELFASIIEETSNSANQAIFAAIQEGGTFLDIIRRVLLKTLQLMADDQRFRGAMQLLLFNSGDSPELLDLRRFQVEQGLAQLEQITGYFQLGLAQSELHPDLDPAIAARAFLAYQNGLVQLWLTAPGVIDLAAHADGLAEIFVHGIAPA